MKHFNEEELIDYYYGESDAAPDIAKHLRQCADCDDAYKALSRDLSEIVSITPPVRDDDYSEQVWQSIRNAVPVYEAPKKQRFAWLRLHPFSGLAAAAACLLFVAAVAFFTGRWW